MADEISEVPCPTCRQRTLTITERLTAKPLGSFSLAGVQPKVSAVATPWLTCVCGAGGPIRLSDKPDGSGRVSIEVLSWGQGD